MANPRVIPMNLPKDIADRLRALDYPPGQFESMLRSEGAEFVRGFIERLEDAERLYQEWSPKLRELAATSRAKNPCPDLDLLSDRDHAKQSIYEMLITNAERLPQRRSNEVLLCSIPLIGIPVAMSLWPGQDDRSLFLTPEEISEWHHIYRHPEDSFWWFTNYWWNIEDPPPTNSVWTRHGPTPPEGTDPWLVISGVSWGSLAGGSKIDLWSWDGTQAQFVGNCGCCDF